MENFKFIGVITKSIFYFNMMSSTMVKEPFMKLWFLVFYRMVSLAVTSLFLLWMSQIIKYSEAVPWKMFQEDSFFLVQAEVA